MLTADVVAGFTVELLGARYDDPAPVPMFHREMWRLCCLPAVQVAVAAPRGHAKSTALTFAFALCGLMLRDFRHVLLISSNETLAGDLLRELVTELRENEALSDEFGPFVFLVESMTEAVVRFPDGECFRVLAKGAGQRMRGLKWRATRPDMVLCDDLEDDEIVLNQDRRERFMRWFYGAVRPLVKEGGRIRLYGTIMHGDSLLERAMPKLSDSRTVVTPLMVSGVGPGGWLSVKYRAHSDDFSEILWPARFSADKLRGIRDEFSAMGILDVYGQEYLNDPIDHTAAYFRRDDLLQAPPGWQALRKEYYAGVDFAISQTTRADYTAIVVGGVDEQRRLHIVDVRRGRWDALEIVRELFAVAERYDCHFRFESDKIEKALRPVLDAEMARRQVFLRYDVKAPTKDKLQRARAFQYRTRAGNVFFDHEAEWWPDLEQELTRFPKAPHDDMVDALAWLGDLVGEELAAQTDEEIADEQWHREYRSSYDQGASLVTGY